MSAQPRTVYLPPFPGNHHLQAIDVRHVSNQAASADQEEAGLKDLPPARLACPQLA